MEDKYILGFSLIPNFGTAKFLKLKNHFNSFEQAWRSSRVEDLVEAGLTAEYAATIKSAQPKIDLERVFRLLKAEKISLILANDKLYPPQLREIKSAPFLLFARGNTQLLEKKQLAVVGTRCPTGYGKLVAEKIVFETGQAGLVITSGLAQGIDAIAHTVALKNNFPTIAVLGNGIDNKCLAAGVNDRIARQILAKNGLIVSEYPPEFEASRITFPARNRIISGLSLGVLVIEAGEQSGSLITARHAVDQNRDVFAVPGNIFSSQSLGTHQLIRQGAMLTTSAKDILEAMNFVYQTPGDKASEVILEDPLEKKIYKYLSYEPQPIDRLVKQLEIDAPAVSTALSMMELRGIVKSIPGGFIKS